MEHPRFFSIQLLLPCIWLRFFPDSSSEVVNDDIANFHLFLVCIYFKLEKAALRSATENIFTQL